MNPIFLGLLMLDALLLWTTIGSRGRWWLKIVVMLVVLTFNFAVWNALDTYRGWPTTEPLPARAVFIASAIEEPSEVDHNPGVIYVWLVPLHHNQPFLGYRASGAEPRAYREPYSQELHQAIQQAQNMQRHGTGQPVMLTSRRGPGTRGANHRGPYRAYVLPSVSTPKSGGR
jgi:hypothetical protein